ncbi:MAG: hypothetical protein WDO16_06405 [Bacteroidota bacterium]
MKKVRWKKCGYRHFSYYGWISLEVYTSNDVLLASKNFSIEEFVPDRIRVNVKLDKPSLKPGESSTLSINAINFFGPPAANRNYETEIQVKQNIFHLKNSVAMISAWSIRTSVFDKEVKEGKTDAEGNAREIYQVPETYSNMGALQTSFYTTVFDETGRPVSAPLLLMYTHRMFSLV